jgi:hypothetical protein
LEKADRRLILALDEFENIDSKIGEGVFSADLLATIRESIQSHRRLIWLSAGSHPLGAKISGPFFGIAAVVAMVRGDDAGVFSSLGAIRQAKVVA